MGSYTWTAGDLHVDAERYGRRMAQAMRLLRSPVEPLTIAGEYALDVARRSFDRQADPRSGSPWARLRPNTVAAKGSNIALVRRGRLKRSFQRGAVGNVWRMGAYSVRVGSRLKTAKFAQQGTRRHLIRPRRAAMLRFITTGGVTFARKVNHPGTPARPMLGFNTGHKLELAKRLKRLIVRRLGEGALNG